MKYILKFDETVESEKELRKFVKQLLPIISEDIYDDLYGKDIHKSSAEAVELFLLPRLGNTPLSIGEITPFIRFDIGRPPFDSEFLKPFFQFMGLEKHFTIKILYHGGNSGGLFNYEHRVIHLYVPKDTFLEICLFMSKYNNPQKAIKEIEKLLSETFFHEAFLHEMTHAYDHFVSEGKIGKGDYYFPTSGDPEDYKKYFSQNVELNAFYSGLIKLLEELGVKYILTFNEIIQRLPLLELFGGSFKMTYLDDEQKNRIIKRMYQWYSAPESKQIESRGILLLYNAVIFDYFENDFKDSSAFSSRRLISQLSSTLKDYTNPNTGRLANTNEMLQYLYQSLLHLARGRVSKKELQQRHPKNISMSSYGRYDFVTPMVYQLVDCYAKFFDELGGGDIKRNSAGFRKYLGFVRFLSEEVGFSPQDFTGFSKNFSGGALFSVDLLRQEDDFREFVT